MHIFVKFYHCCIYTFKFKNQKSSLVHLFILRYNIPSITVCMFLCKSILTGKLAKESFNASSTESELEDKIDSNENVCYDSEVDMQLILK